jgi:cellulose synthase/poly-beta-1,6-N-acetylglucosamine synthase-like glycosyltransferase
LRSLTHLYYLGKYEVILVNNRSTDNTVDLAKKHKTRVIDAFDFQGSYYARNAGIASSNSQIVAFTDADCVADKNWIHYLVQHMMQNPQMAGVGGEISHVARNAMETIFGKLGIRHSVEGAIPSLARATPCLATANVAYWRKAIKEVGFFDATFSSGGDMDLTWRVLKKGYQIAAEPQAIVYHFPRENPWSFFKQYYKYGLGQAKLRRKHGIEVDQASEVFQLLENESVLVGRFLFRLAKGMISKKDRNSISVMTPVFTAIPFFAFTAGIIRGNKAVCSK